MAHDDSGCRSIVLDLEPDGPRAARGALVEWFPDLPVQVRENALVVVTELVSNAIRFGRAPIHVSARLGADALVLEVKDEGKGRPRRRVPSETGGIGLNLVFLLADRVEIDAGSPTVRCEFDLPADEDRHLEGSLCEIELIRQATTLRIVLRGEIDLSARPELDRLFAQLDPSQLDPLVVDLREVTFFDTTGLRMAHRFDRWGRDHDVSVVFTHGIPTVMRALAAAGLTLRLRFSDAPEDQL